MYNLLWVLYMFSAGLLTYVVFQTNWVLILIGILLLEILFYLIYRKSWLFVKRYLFNLFYVFGYVTPLLFG
jgi:hypothetical protein